MVKLFIKILSLLTVMLITEGQILYAQQFPDYSLFYINKYSVNPAIAGANQSTNLSFIAREESVGFEGTPKTHSFSFDSRVLGRGKVYNKIVKKRASGNVGWGLNLYSDLNGPIDKTGISGTYSYHIDNNDGQLSFGISFVLFQLSIKKGDFITDDGQLENDPLLMGGNETIWITDANFGVYYASDTYFMGYSTVQLFNSFAQFGAEGQGKYKLKRLHNIIAGYNFEVSRKFHLEPSTLIRVDESLRIQANVGTRLIYERKFWGGIYYKTMSTLSFHCGVNFEKYYFAYSFDYGINSLNKYSYGTHELVASVKLGDRSRYRFINKF